MRETEPLLQFRLSVQISSFSLAWEILQYIKKECRIQTIDYYNPLEHFPGLTVKVMYFYCDKYFLVNDLSCTSRVCKVD